MHEQDVNTGVFNTQADNAVNTTCITELRQQSFDIESATADAVILVDAIFDTIDDVGTVPEALQRSVSAINCFATCAMRNLVLIAEANRKVLTISATGGL